MAIAEDPPVDAAVTDDAPLIAVLTAMLSGHDLASILEHVLSQEDDPIDFAFRDRTRVKAAAKLAASLLPPERPLLGQSTGPAGRWVRRTSTARRAAYVLAAARRLAAREADLQAERRYLAQHLAAERARVESAAKVDADGTRYGPVLGWYAILDDRTDPICRALAGHNFLASAPPAQGWPGTLHGGTCRCSSGPAFPQGELLGAKGPA